MDTLKTNHPLALSLLINEDIYVFKADSVSLPPDTPSDTDLTPVGPDLVFNYLGENNQSILIIVNDPEAEFINETDLDFLLKILSAKKLDLNAIAILNIARHTNYGFENLKHFFACNRILTFGINPAILEMQGLNSNTLQEFNGVKFLGTWSLRQMVNDDNKKRTYWNVLKTF